MSDDAPIPPTTPRRPTPQKPHRPRPRVWDTSAKSILTLHATMTRPAMRLAGRDIDRRDRQHGYSKCGYHYVIQRDGVVYQGRQDGEPSIHDDAESKIAISICLVGGLDERQAPENNFTLPQWDVLRPLIQALREMYPAIKETRIKTSAVDGVALDRILTGGG